MIIKGLDSIDANIIVVVDDDNDNLIINKSMNR